MKKLVLLVFLIHSLMSSGQNGIENSDTTAIDLSGYWEGTYREKITQVSTLKEGYETHIIKLILIKDGNGKYKGVSENLPHKRPSYYEKKFGDRMEANVSLSEIEGKLFLNETSLRKPAPLQLWPLKKFKVSVSNKKNKQVMTGISSQFNSKHELEIYKVSNEIPAEQLKNLTINYSEKVEISDVKYMADKLEHKLGSKGTGLVLFKVQNNGESITDNLKLSYSIFSKDAIKITESAGLENQSLASGDKVGCYFRIEVQDQLESDSLSFGVEVIASNTKKVLASTSIKLATRDVVNQNKTNIFSKGGFVENDTDTSNTNNLIKDPETVKDIDGNIYSTIKIGTQIWLKENLRTGSYANGDKINAITDNSLFELTRSGAYRDLAYPKEDSLYGKLYNYFTVADPRGLCPIGWHVPDTIEWNILINNVGGSKLAGLQLKEKGTGHWLTPNYTSNITTEFNALPRGYAIPEDFLPSGQGITSAYFWSSNEHTDLKVPCLFMFYIGEGTLYLPISVLNGIAVRCIKNK